MILTAEATRPHDGSAMETFDLTARMAAFATN
jgi:hypothetical protein